MTANNNKSYLAYLNILVDQYSNSYHHSIGKKPIDTDYSDLTEKIESNLKAPKFKVDDRVRITEVRSIIIFLVKVTLKIGPEEYLLSILC